LKKAVEDLQKVTDDLKTLKDAAKLIPELRKKVAEAEARLDVIEYDLAEIKKKLDKQSTTTLRPANEAPNLKGQGRLRFVNQFSEEMAVVVNGKSYRLTPGEERVIPVPPGDYRYQVLQLQAVAQERRILADETKTITIYPLR
jgi:DNA gyrase/topoisomerase IV subunit A